MGRFRRSWLHWKPTFEYSCNPWKCYADFLEVLIRRGAEFITMREAVDGDYDDQAINILLDHHIDSGPIETEVMCRWEQSRGARSSVYLFNQSAACRSTTDGNAWKLDDLSIETYKDLERSGFEIGYHNNAVGQARSEVTGDAVGPLVSPALFSRAKELFSRDVESLKRHFHISTVIPHGGGQGNHLLKELPQSCSDLVWTYNDAKSAKAGERRPIFKNWTDTASRGLRPQIIGSPHVTYVVRHHNLHIGACLAKPGLNHFLVHSNRFGQGMPYELYSDPQDLQPLPIDLLDFKFSDDLPLPYTLHGLTASRRWQFDSLAARSLDSVAEASPTNAQPRLLLTDCTATLGHMLLSQPHWIGHFARNQAFDRHELGLTRQRDTSTVRRPTAADVPRGMLDDCDPGVAFSQDDENFASYAPFYNEVYSRKLFRHLDESDLRFDAVLLRNWFLDGRGELEALSRFLVRAANEETAVYLTVHVHEAEPQQCRSSLSPAAKRVEIDTQAHPSGGSIITATHRSPCIAR